jgi:hypothetical protein
MEEREHLKEELEGGEINKQVVANVQELLAALPQLSPYHLLLFHFLIKGMPCSAALHLFNTSTSTYHQAQRLDKIPLLEVKYKLNLSKKKVSNN